MELSNEDLEALVMLEDMLISPRLLALLRLQGTYTGDPDAFDKQMGCGHLQKHPNGHNKKTGYWPRSLKDPERTYDIT